MHNPNAHIKITREQRGGVFKELCIQCGIKIDNNTSQCFPTKAIRSKHREVFWSILANAHILNFYETASETEATDIK